MEDDVEGTVEDTAEGAWWHGLGLFELGLAALECDARRPLALAQLQRLRGLAEEAPSEVAPDVSGLAAALATEVGRRPLPALAEAEELVGAVWSAAPEMTSSEVAHREEVALLRLEELRREAVARARALAVLAAWVRLRRRRRERAHDGASSTRSADLSDGP